MITHAVIFAPIGQVSRSDQIVQRLSNAIITGLLEPKEQLPNETDLAKNDGCLTYHYQRSAKHASG